MSQTLPLNLADWDENCMQEFIEQNSASFYVFANRYVEDKEAIDDFLQEAYIKLWTHRHTIGVVKSPRNYFFTIIRNVILDKWSYFQHNESEKDLQAYINVASNESFVERIIEVESSLLIARAIETLSPQSRRIILLSMQGETMKEIADSLRISVNTVKKIKYRALKRLSEQLSKEDFLFVVLALSILKCQ